MRAPSEREIVMRDMFVQGITMQAIGEKFGVSRERVRQILEKRFALSAKDGGKQKAISLKREAKASKRMAQIAARWGVGYETWRACRSSGLLRAYEQHQKNSAARAIPFLLTFGQWLDIWTSSGKLDQRGRGKGKYCMSRLNDEGPYAAGNVHIQPCEVNSADATKKWIGVTKKNRCVFLLYPGRPNPWVVIVGQHRVGSYATEEAAVVARDAFIRERGVQPGTIGRGRGWTLRVHCKSKPYLVQVTGTKATSHASQEEAEAEYRRRVAEVVASRQKAV